MITPRRLKSMTEQEIKDMIVRLSKLHLTLAQSLNRRDQITSQLKTELEKRNNA